MDKNDIAAKTDHRVCCLMCVIYAYNNIQFYLFVTVYYLKASHIKSMFLFCLVFVQMEFPLLRTLLRATHSFICFAVYLFHSHALRIAHRSIDISFVKTMPVEKFFLFFAHWKRYARQRHPTTQHSSSSNNNNKYIGLQKCIIYMVMASQCEMKNACSKRQQGPTKGSTCDEIGLKWENMKYVNLFLLFSRASVSVCACV